MRQAEAGCAIGLANGSQERVMSKTDGETSFPA